MYYRPNQMDRGNRKGRGRARLFLSAVRRTFTGSSCKTIDVVHVDNSRINYYNHITTTTEEAAAAVVEVEEIEWKEEEALTQKDIAAIKIQAHFRGHLARQAYRALRSVVKVQAAVRGMCERRQARLAINCMEALVRLQVRVRARQLLGTSAWKKPCVENPKRDITL